MKAVVLCLCILASIVVAVHAKTIKLNWRNPHPLDMTVDYGDTLFIYWKDSDTKTGIVQMEYPGVCTNGSPANKTRFTGVKIKGDTGSKYLGKLKITFNTAGSFFFTSPVKGECDSKWLHVTVNTPPSTVVG